MYIIIITVWNTFSILDTENNDIKAPFFLICWIGTQETFHLALL